jgi:protein phosphatase 1 regulatory subunit 7
MEGLEELVNLEDLYLSHNGLKKIEGLEKNVSRVSLRAQSAFSFCSGRD